MTTLRISITKEVLEATKDCKVNDSHNCAIAYAVRMIWPNADVGLMFVIPFGDNGKKMDQPLIPHDQFDFIMRYDSATPAERAAMQPFSFDIEVPDSVIGEVNIEEIRGICEGSKTLELVK